MNEAEYLSYEELWRSRRMLSVEAVYRSRRIIIKRQKIILLFLIAIRSDLFDPPKFCLFLFGTRYSR